MMRLDELLEPITEGEPAGPDLSTSDEYAEIERRYREADVPPALSPGGAIEEPDSGFGEVADLAAEFLRLRSKDVKIGTLLTGALLREEGFSGLAGGLELLHGLLDRFWDDLHPAAAGRAAVLTWLGSEDMSYALYLLPLTTNGHTFSQYKEWTKEGYDSADDAVTPLSDEISAHNFGSAFAETSRDWYGDLCASLARSSAALEALDALGRDKFAASGEQPPRYKALADTIKRISAAAQDLLGRKPAPPDAATPAAGSATSASDAGVAAGSGGAVAGDSASSAAAARVDPRDPSEAATAVAAAARVFRQADPSHPASYLLLRGFRWGELLAAGEHPDPRDLIGPTTEQRTHLKSLFLEQKWEALLEAAEVIMATPAGRGWLDLQRYTVLAAERLGAEYRHVSSAVRRAVAALLADLPGLAHATLMDDSATASRDTLEWLESQGLIEGEAGDRTAEPDGASDTDATRIIREATFGRAAGLARAGDPQGAIELLMERGDHEGSDRARFITRAEAAAIMVEHGMRPLARPILDELHALITEHKLEQWESPEVVARPLSLLFRCLDASEASLKQQLYNRLAKLDPVLALRVNADGGRAAASGTPEAAAEEPAAEEPAPVNETAPAPAGEE